MHKFFWLTNIKTGKHTIGIFYPFDGDWQLFGLDIECSTSWIQKHYIIGNEIEQPK